MHPPPMHIIGLGSTQQATLSAPAHAALLASDCVYGSPRQLATVARYLDHGSSPVTAVELPKLQQLEPRLRQRGQAKITILASGDPLFYGIGGWLCRHFQARELIFHPAISSMQSACHRLGLSLQEVTVVSLHGRPLATLRTHLRPHSTLLVLTDAASHPTALARECCAAGFDQSQLTVCENLGYAAERIRRFSAGELLTATIAFEPLHISVIRVEGPGGLLPQFPGFADALFETGTRPGQGMLSKREVRLQILSYLQPGNGDIIWDIGAGCGGVAVELAYWNPRTQVYAIEQHRQRLHCLHLNRERFGVVSNLTIVAGRAPDCLHDLPAASKIFIGGSDGALAAMLNPVWAQLPADGMLVASAVTASTRQYLLEFADGLADANAEYTEIGVRRGSLDDQGWSHQSKRPVTIFVAKKTGAGR